MSKLKNTKILTTTAMLCAVAIVLGFFKIPVTQLVEIRFQTLPIAIAGYLYGGFVGGIVGGVADVGGYIVKPTGPYFVGFTISTVISGVIFGSLLHVEKPSLKRIFLAEALNTLIVGVCLNSLWLAQLYGNGIIAVIASRIVKELVMLPINTLIMATVLNSLRRLHLVTFKTI